MPRRLADAPVRSITRFGRCRAASQHGTDHSMAHVDGWSGLFASAFRQSRNAMVLLDERRRIVDVNAALLQLARPPPRRDAQPPDVGVRRGRPDRHRRASGAPAMFAERFTGTATLVAADGSRVAVQWGATTETVDRPQARPGRRAEHVALGRALPPRADDAASRRRALRARAGDRPPRRATAPPARRSPTSCTSRTTPSAHTCATRWVRWALVRAPTSWRRPSATISCSAPRPDHTSAVSKIQCPYVRIAQHVP